MDRRQLLRTMCLGGLATFVAPVARFARVPGPATGPASSPPRLVFVLLRGGFDGLAAVVPIGDRHYESIRGPMAFEADALTPLADGFALAPGLAPLHELWARDELVVLQALAIPYRTRSHFDGQAVLETGLDRPVGASDGWLNRLLQVMGGESAGLAVAAGLPRSLAGSAPVLTWSPAELGVAEDAYVERLERLYREDPRLHERFEAALRLRQTAGSATAGPAAGSSAGDRVGGLFQAAARLLSPEDGPNVAALELGGWDTHAAQGMADGALDRRLAALAAGLAVFRRALGSAWAGTTVVVMTEFGRTARPNGTGGTDHGTAGAGFVLGPGVARSAVSTDWPGLAPGELYEGRDLRPTLDTRAVLKAVVAAAFDLTGPQVERVFPGSLEVRPARGLMA